MDEKDPALARLADQVQLAARQGVALCIRGGGTKDFYGRPGAGEALEVSPLAGISSYEPSELVVTARAGTPLAEVEAALEEKGQCLPFEPPRFAAQGTIGGMVAAGLSGPARANVGSVRDHLLGVTLLDGRGAVLSFGGQVAKNVAGYDVSRLMAGSLGILGVICEVSLKVLPVSRAGATLRFDCDEFQALELLKTWSSQPLPLSASVWRQGQLWLRLAGARAAVDAACKRLGGSILAADTAQALWLSMRDHTDAYFCGATHALPAGERLWRLSVPAHAAPIALPGLQLIEWHGAQRWWRTSAAVPVVRAAAARIGGHATLLRGAGDSDAVFSPLSEVLLKIHRGLKQAFDPAGIFNRGRLYAEL